MRVLHLIKTSHGATWAVRQMHHLARRGTEVHVAMPPGGPRVDQCKSLGMTVHALPLDFPVRRPWAIPGILSGFRRLIKEVSPDLIHSHFVGTTLIMRLALGRNHSLPRIFQVAGPLHLERGPYGPIEIALAGPQDHWIASCRWTEAKYLALGVRSEQVHQVYYGVNASAIENLEKGKLRRELGMDDDALLIGIIAYMYPPKYYLGQFRGLKGHEDFFSAMVEVRKRWPKAFAVIVGAQCGPRKTYERRLRRLARKLLGDAALFLGHRTDVPLIYADLNVAVHPSLSENLGGAGESLLAGVPTVATRVGGFPDIVRPGETGWLVPPRRPEQLAQAILEVLSDPEEAQHRTRTGRTLVRKITNPHQTTQELLAIYEKVLSLSGKCSQGHDATQLQAA